ncbi:MAG: dihydroxyacetone kinase subunit DhaL [Verrucomicrobiota bacterium]
MKDKPLSVEEAKQMLLVVALAIIDAEPVLSDADRALGDGDHGVGMKRGMEAVIERLQSNDFESIEKLFSAMGMEMMSSMGGASGAIFGTFYRSGGKAIAGAEAFGPYQLAEFLEAAAAGVMKRGGAKPGDKTMLDALVPAAERAAEVREKPLMEALEAVADAAESGRDASKDMVATMGRAKTLGDKSLGHPDAGAVSVAIMLRTMQQYAAT